MNPTRHLARSLTVSPTLSGLSRRDRALLARHAGRLHLTTGVTLVHQGEATTAWFVVLSGRVLVLDGATTVRRLGPGATFDDASAVTGEPATAAVVAEAGATVAVIPARMFRTLLHQVPDLGLALLAQMARRVNADQIALSPTKELGRSWTTRPQHATGPGSRPTSS